MTDIGIHVLLVQLGIRSAALEIFDGLRAFGNSYQLASSGIGSGISRGRFMLGFLRAVVLSFRMRSKLSPPFARVGKIRSEFT